MEVTMIASLFVSLVYYIFFDAQRGQICGAQDIIEKMDNLKSAGISAVQSILGGNGQQNSQNQQNQQNQQGKKQSTNGPDIPKEELVALCLKLNKKVQALDTKNNELSKQIEIVNGEKDYLLETFSILLNTSLFIPNETNIDKQLIQNGIQKWKSLHEEKQFSYDNKILELESEIAKLKVSQSQKHSTNDIEYNKDIGKDQSDSCINNDESAAQTQTVTESNDNSDRIKSLQAKLQQMQQEIQTYQTSENYYKLQITSLEEELKRRNSRNEILEKDVTDIRIKYEEKITKYQQQLKDAERDMKLAKEKNLSLQNQLDSQQTKSNSDMNLKVTENEVKMKRLEEHTQELDIQLKSVLAMKVELEENIQSYLHDIDTLKQTKIDQEIRIKELLHDLHKAQNHGIENQNYIQQIQELKLLIEENNSMIMRLRQESLHQEHQYAMKMTELANTELKVESITKELQIKEDTTKEALERVSLLQTRLATAEHRLEERVKEFNIQLDQKTQEINQMKEQQEVDIQAIQTKHDLYIESIQRENAKKSSTARILLSEKEEEIHVLQAKIQELQQEVTSGAPAERKIFELASVQAKRDAVYNLQSENREIAIQQLQAKLAQKDTEVAQLQQIQLKLTTELTELRRVTKREDVNMDYLKNIIIQYMTFPVASPERQQLVPVICTLLQFNPSEQLEVDKSMKDSVWGGTSRPVIEIKRSLKKASEMN